jgi:hypothetical protein
MGAPGRVELPTFGLGNRCSIHLSYRANRFQLNYRTANPVQAALKVCDYADNADTRTSPISPFSLKRFLSLKAASWAPSPAFHSTTHHPEPGKAKRNRRSDWQRR